MLTDEPLQSDERTNSDPSRGGLMLTRLAFALPLVFVAYVEGFLNPFWLWNSLPFGVGLGLVDRAQRLGRSLWPAAGFTLGSGAFSLYFHVAWLFDWSGTSTSSSTSAVMFVFLPIYAFVPGAFGYAAGKAIDEFRRPD